MKINSNNTIHCFWCNKDYWMCEVFINVLFEGSVTCLNDHLLGYEKDKEWKIITK